MSRLKPGTVFNELWLVWGVDQARSGHIHNPATLQKRCWMSLCSQRYRGLAQSCCHGTWGSLIWQGLSREALCSQRRMPFRCPWILYSATCCWKHFPVYHAADHLYGAGQKPFWVSGKFLWDVWWSHRKGCGQDSGHGPIPLWLPHYNFGLLLCSVPPR